MNSNIAFNPLEAPDKFQMPHRFGIFPIRKNGQPILALLLDYSLNRLILTLLIALEIMVKRIAKIIPMLNLLFIFQSGYSERL